MATSSVSSAATGFSGMSTYAADFKQVIERAVGIASLPLTQYEDNLAALNSQVAEYQKLDADTTALKTAVQQLGTAIGTSYTVTSSSQTVASAKVATGVMAATYKLEVTDAGAYSQFMSSSALSNTASATTYTLTVDGSTHTIKPSGTTIQDLAEAINASGAAVQASAVNMGSSTSPDYRLSIQSSTLGPMAISLDSGAGDVMAQVGDAGRPATYIVNNQVSVPVSSSTATIQLAPGLSVSLLAAGTTTIQVSSSTSGIEKALNQVASAYNTVMTELKTNRGQSSGPLKGASQVYALEAGMRQLMTYASGSGNVQSLVNLGLEFDQNGTATINTSTLASVSFQDMKSFLGDGVGQGFLSDANNLLDEMDGTSHGTITDSVAALKEQVTSTNSQIDKTQSQVDLLRTSLTHQIASADSAIYALQQQAQYFTNLFDAMQADKKAMSS